MLYFLLFILCHPLNFDILLRILFQATVYKKFYTYVSLSTDKPVDVQINSCGDPVSSETICKLLQDEMCVCKDPAIRPLCENYCEGNCDGHKHTDSNCVPVVCWYFYLFRFKCHLHNICFKWRLSSYTEEEKCLHFMYGRSAM